MAVSYLLQLKDIPGEFQEFGKYHFWIEIDNFNWGQSQSGASQYGAGSGSGRVAFHDFAFTKHTDKSSPKIFEKCATGENIPDATLICRRSGAQSGELEEFYKVEFKDLIVSSYQTSGHDGDAGLPVENISLNFASSKMTYFVQKAGKDGGFMSAGYDVRTGVAI